jgi:patatin-like phospholipase/acyl hydrolase
VCRATAAAPTYFPPAYVTSVDGTINGTLIDGGAIQNNPALVATTHALSNNEEFPEATSLQDILILSLGAGQMDKTHELSRAKKWGMTGWVRPLMDIMMDGTAGKCSCLQIYQANSLLSLTAHWTSLNLGP